MKALVLPIAILFALLAADGSAKPKPLGAAPTPGETYTAELPGLQHPLLFNLPENYDKKRKWPVLIHYHGTSGKPNFDLLEGYTGGNNFLLVGMTYLKRGQYQYSEENLQKELAICHQAIDKLAEHTTIDRKRVYVGGFSKGAWVSAMFLDHDSRFAGAYIIGGGVFDHQLYKPKKFARRTPVYIGVGQLDGNSVMSLNAKVHFRKLGAEVILDIVPRGGHGWPYSGFHSETFQQWIDMLVLEDRPELQKLTMQRWFDKELPQILEKADTTKRYTDLEGLIDKPAVALLGKPARNEVEKALEAMRTKEPIKSEWEVEQKYRKIVRYELKDRFLETLKTCHQGYQDLAEKFPNTIYGKRAAIDAKRTGTMIDYSAKRQAKKNKEAREK